MPTHPPIEQWVDFARGVADDTSTARLTAHSLRCASCRRTLEAFRAVAALGRREADYAVPSDTLGAAMSLIPRHDRTAPEPWTRATGRLVFDSWLVPNFVGVRSHGRGERHLTFRSAGWDVDVRIERPKGAPLSILGQVARTRPGQGKRTGKDAGTVAPSLAGTPVRLMSGGRACASGTMNEFGEFQLECEKRVETLRLDIPIALRRLRLDVPFRVADTNGVPSGSPQRTSRPRTAQRSGTKPAGSGTNHGQQRRPSTGRRRSTK
jgi:hypothetical protein